MHLIALCMWTSLVGFFSFFFLLFFFVSCPPSAAHSVHCTSRRHLTRISLPVVPSNRRRRSPATPSTSQTQQAPPLVSTADRRPDAAAAPRHERPALLAQQGVSHTRDRNREEQRAGNKWRHQLGNAQPLSDRSARLRSAPLLSLCLSAAVPSCSSSNKNLPVSLTLEHVSPVTRLLEKRKQMLQVQESLDSQKVGRTQTHTASGPPVRPATRTPSGSPAISSKRGPWRRAHRSA